MAHRSLAPAWLSPEARPLLLRRIHSLTGALALGFFLLIHLWMQGQALYGWGAYALKLRWGDLPLIPVLEILLVYLPLLYHALAGIGFILKPRPNFSRYPFRKNWAWALQRVTGVMTLLFIAYHFWSLRLQVWLGTMSPADYFPRLCGDLSSTNSWGIPLKAFVYLLGGAACIAHFCNGLSGFCFLWGITRTRKQAEFASWAFAAFGALLFAYFAATILFFATGSTPIDWLS